jgi:hypothetical protein
MGVIRVEPEEQVKDSHCPTCGGTSRLMHGYIYEDEHPQGLYFLEWCDGRHPRRQAWLTIGLGDFSDESNPSDRNSFCIEWRAEGMRLADQPARDRPDLLGAFLTRDVALLQPNIDQLWHVADHIVTDDPRVAAVDEWVNNT